ARVAEGAGGDREPGRHARGRPAAAGAPRRARPRRADGGLAAVERGHSRAGRSRRREGEGRLRGGLRAVRSNAFLALALGLMALLAAFTVVPLVVLVARASATGEASLAAVWADAATLHALRGTLSTA